MWFTLHPTPPPIEAKEPCLHSHIWTQGEGGGRIRDVVMENTSDFLSQKNCIRICCFSFPYLFTMEYLRVVAGNFAGVFHSNFWTFLCICQAPLSRSLWSGFHWKDILLVLEYRSCQFSSNAITSEVKRQKWTKANARHGLLRPARRSMG